MIYWFKDTELHSGYTCGARSYSDDAFDNAVEMRRWCVRNVGGQYHDWNGYFIYPGALFAVPHADFQFKRETDMQEFLKSWGGEASHRD